MQVNIYHYLCLHAHTKDYSTNARTQNNVIGWIKLFLPKQNRNVKSGLLISVDLLFQPLAGPPTTETFWIGTKYWVLDLPPFKIIVANLSRFPGMFLILRLSGFSNCHCYFLPFQKLIPPPPPPKEEKKEKSHSGSKSPNETQLFFWCVCWAFLCWREKCQDVGIKKCWKQQQKNKTKKIFSTLFFQNT